MEHFVHHPILNGLTLLVVEDEPLIALDIAMAFEECGAHITSTNTLKHAVLLVEHDGLSGAILDHALPDGDSSILCARLKERGVPFMIYSGHENVEGACQGAPHLSKPATPDMMVAAMVDLIRTARLATQQ
jgi:DNA-binding response OmpR family regulator